MDWCQFMNRTFTPSEPEDYDIAFEIKYRTKGFKVELEGEPPTDDESLWVWKITYGGNTLFCYVDGDEMSHFKSFSGSDPTEILNLIGDQFKYGYWDNDTLNLFEQMKSGVKS